jgi:plastocyanin
MNKKYIIAAIVIVLAVCGGFLLGKRSVIAPEGPGSIPNGAVEQATTTPEVAAPVAKPSAPKTTTTTKVSTPSAPAAPLMTKDGAYIVSYTDKGFVPATLEIVSGKSVHFVNNSNKAMSLTSVDQNSQIFSEFNQSKTVGRGGSYDFTFLAKGTWWYVNRNDQTQLGTIIVK